MEKALVIIPTYNEAENIKKVIEATIREKKFDVLVVDDSSPDGTATIVKEIIKSFNANHKYIKNHTVFATYFKFSIDFLLLL